MAVPKREQHQNLSYTLLDGGCDDNDTSIAVDDGTVFPSSGNFRLICEQEIMICTARSGNTLTVVRGQEGTTPEAHADDAEISLIYTAGSLSRIMQDFSGEWGYSSNLPNGVYNDAGTGRLVSTDFTWVNQGGASRSDGSRGNIYLRIPSDGAATNLRMLSLTPGVSTFAYVASIKQFGAGDGNFTCFSGLGLRENATSKVMTIGHFGSSNSYNWGAHLAKWTNSTTVTGGSFTKSLPFCFVGDRLYLRVALTATHVVFSYSLDGFEWVQIHSETITTHFTTAPDEVVFCAANINNSQGDLLASLEHWHKE